MAIIKITPQSLATDAVETAKINDDAVTTAKVLDNNVTLAKLGDGTQGDVLYYGASGAPARLGFGTSGDFLKTQGTGANPVWASASSDYVKIQTTTLGSATTPWTIDGWIDGSTYKAYAIYMYNVSTANDGGWILGRWVIGGTVHTGSDYMYANAIPNSGGSVYTDVSSSATYWRVHVNSTNTYRRMAGQIILSDPTNTSFYHSWTNTSYGYDGAANQQSIIGGGVLKSTSALTGISFYSSGGGNMVADSTLTIYGIKA